MSRSSVRWLLLLSLLGCGVATDSAPTSASGAADRAYTVAVMTRIAEPVLIAANHGELIATLKKQGGKRYLATSPLEVLGRTVAGIAPWLELGPEDSDEGRLRAKFAALTLDAIRRGTDPTSPDRVSFTNGAQPLVDAAFLAHGLLRARTQLWDKLSKAEQANVIAGLKATPLDKTYHNNWLLFAGIIEAAIWEFTGECDLKPIDNAVAAFEKWYLGDGTYGDGHDYHADYYNSYVIQPMYLAILEICAKHDHAYGKLLPKAQTRARRYAEFQERMISPEGTFPVMGRSSSYRFGAFQHLSDMALHHQLPATLKPSATRAALTAVIRRMIEAKGTFDADGWLTIGVVGNQPAIADSYNSVASPYLCLCGLLHLGLPAKDPFWSEPATPWTQQRIWAGEDVANDHFMEEGKEKEKEKEKK